MRDQYGATTTTATRVYEMLEREGLVTRTQGSGVYVAQPHSPAKTGTIGFTVIGSLQGLPYYVHLLEGVRHAADLADAEILLIGDKPTLPWEKVDGVIYPGTLNDQLIKLHVPHAMPLVSLIYAHPSIDSVLADDYVGMTQAMEHLLQQGHRRIAFLTQELQPHSISNRRTQAYRDALRRYGIEPNAAWMRCLQIPGITGRGLQWTAYGDMQQWLADNWRSLGCTALLAQNDQVAVGAITAFQEAGLQVPEDVSVVGFDGTELARLQRPQLTTVKVPLEEIGAQGCELLLRRISQPFVESADQVATLHTMLPTQLEIGGTTAPPPSQP
jgi:DNA-binding LacI/PurR family transcriptional regulator